ncbi:MAG: L,D-transpeptidase family protein [Pseudomonadota bacterium]
MRSSLVRLVFVAFLLTFSKAYALDASLVTDLSGRDAISWRNIVVSTDRVLPYYALPGAENLWTSGSSLSAEGEALIAAIEGAMADGLVPSDYLPLALRNLQPLSGAADAVGLELSLSNAFMAFARDLHAGRTTPSVTDPEIVIARKDSDPAQWLGMVQRDGVARALQMLRPQHPQYFQLRQLLAGYRSLAARGGWLAVPDGDVLKPGMSDARVVDIRNNLAARGYSGIVQVAQPEVYDEGLQPVIEHFQKRHGLDQDGVVGPATLRAMNVSAEERVRQIIVNMERWRWLPVDLGERHVFVNQAGFQMFTMDAGRLVDTRRVIVGKPFHRTPIFSDTIRYAEFNPIWTVPNSIAVRDKLPLLRKDPSYADRAGFKFYRGWSGNDPEVSTYAVDWSAVSDRKFPFRMVQQPGPKNALGQVKFMFPNKFAVYLHDTPSRQLFARTGRAFSSGCIRVNKPLEFAAILFGMDQNMSRTGVDDIIASRRTTRVNLQSPVPVHLAYFTSWVDENGVPSFFDDVYERDDLVSRLLFTEV